LNDCVLELAQKAGVAAGLSRAAPDDAFALAYRPGLSKNPTFRRFISQVERSQDQKFSLFSVFAVSARRDASPCLRTPCKEGEASG